MYRNVLKILVVVTLQMFVLSARPGICQRPTQFENPIAIDGLFRGFTFVLGERGTIYRTFPQNGAVKYSVLTHIPGAYIPVDLSISAGKNQSLLGARSALIVIANSTDSPNPAGCMIFAFDAESGGTLATWPLTGRCGGLDVFPGAKPYAYLTSLNGNNLFRLDVSSRGSTPEFVANVGGGIGRVGPVAIEVTKNKTIRWFVADATGAGIVLVTQTATGFKSQKIAGVNTSVSSLRMGSNHYLYATDTSKRRVFHLIPKGDGFTVDVRPQIDAELFHPSGIATTAGDWFAVTDDKSGSVLFCDAQGKVLARIP
jgi:hypothetical protein